MPLDRLVLVLATLLACEAPTSHTVDAEASNVAAVLVGCARIDAHTCTRPPPGPATRCEPTRRPSDDSDAFTPVVWLADGREGDEVRIDGESPVRVGGTPIAGGMRFELDVPPDADAIAIVRDGALVQSWTLADAPAEPDAIARARSARSLPDDERERVTRALDAALPELADHDRATALDILADVRFRRADTADAEDRTARWRDALAITHDAHAFATERGDQLRAHCHAQRGLFVALEHLDDAAAIEHWRSQLTATNDLDPSAGRDGYSRGLVAQRLGDLQAAARELAAAEDGARRFADRKLGAAAAQQLAAVLASLGRDDEAAAALDRADRAASDLDCRTWLNTSNNTSWERALSRESGRVTADPVPDLANALLLLDAAVDPDHECHDPRLAEHVRLGLALVAAAEGWTGWAEQLRADLPHELAAAAGTEAWRIELDRRLALASDDSGALVEWLTTRVTDTGPVTLDGAWSRAWGRGQVLEALASPDDALLAYDEAERTLSLMMLQLDFDAGRDRLLLGRQRSAGRRVALLVARGEDARALCAARIARARTSRVLDRSARIAALSDAERHEWLATIARHTQLRREIDALRSERWSLPLDRRAALDARVVSLEAQATGASRRAATMIATGGSVDDDEVCEHVPDTTHDELSLTYFPGAAGETWYGFAADRTGVTAHPIAGLPAADADLASWSATLLEPFRERIASAQALRILPTGALWTVPFSALPWDRDVLIASRPITLGLDLAGRPQIARDSGLRALVVADPRGDLPAAVTEADGVASALQSAGWTVTALRDDEVSADALRRELPRAELLHYAGHGRHEGIEGWQSALELAGGGRLEVADVLALPAVPAEIALPACDTAPSAAATLGGDMNIARAFLLAGADAVIAAQGSIADELAARVAVAVYARPPIEPTTAAARLRGALLAARDDPALPEGVRAQWSRIVVMVR